MMIQVMYDVSTYLETLYDFWTNGTHRLLWYIRFWNLPV